MSPRRPHKNIFGDDGFGVALFDCDNDGRLDIFFVNGARVDDPMRRAPFLTKTIRVISTVCITRKQTARLKTLQKRADLLVSSMGWVWQRATMKRWQRRLLCDRLPRNRLYHNNGNCISPMSRNSGRNRRRLVHKRCLR